MPDLAKLPDWFLTHGVNLLITFSVLLVAYHVLRLLPHPLNRFMPQASKLLFEYAVEGFLKFFIVIMAIVYALPQFGIDPTPIIASLGIVGLAIGFASQLLVRDVISGFVLLTEQRVRKGEWISAGGGEGIVESYDLRGVTLKDNKNFEHYVPWGEIRKITRCQT